MDKLDSELLYRVENALDLKLEDWQINYILDIPMVLDMRITRRQSGKTLAYVIKLLFSSDEPIRSYSINEMVKISDNYDPHEIGRYEYWFRDFLYEIYKKLSSSGIKPRLVFFEKHDELIHEGRRH